MDRRDVLSLLGATAAGMTVGISDRGAAGAAESHEGVAPVEGFHLHLCAFHIAKKAPKFQVQAHHYCSMVNEEARQCIIFDSAGKGARILGVEYIISDRLYRGLPDAEKKYYHPHTYEVLSGLLIEPGMSELAEHDLMGKLVRTWGKTWHTWPDPKAALPMGEPLLMWSHTKDGQIDPELLAGCDRRLKVSTQRARRARADLGPVPQVNPPKSVEEIGRQWTNDGPDEPARK
jgi:Protein of unknown function (DUF1264)